MKLIARSFLIIASLIVSLSAGADIVKPLAKDDSLGKVTQAIATQLADGNISGGTNTLWAGQLKVSGSFEKLVRDGFAQAFEYDTEEKLPVGVKLEITIGKFVDGDTKKGDVYKMTSALIESNDYNTENKELRAGQAAYLWAVLRKLPVSNKTLIGHVKTKLEDSSSGEMRNIQYFLLLNADKKAVQFYTVEGSM